MILKKKRLMITLMLTRELTERLLDAKGFSDSCEKNRKNLIEKSVLLVTEVSELADAVKKNLGYSEEMDEVADILIRMVGYLLMFPEISNRLNEKFESEDPEAKKEYSPIFFDFKPDDIYFKKLSLINDIQNQIFQLNTIVESYFEYGASDSELIDSIIECMMNIQMMCENYMDLFIYSIDLQIAITEKIKKNYLRPMKYGYGEK